MKQFTVINSAIKGYHVFRVKPHNLVNMDVIPEMDNKYDSNAMIIKMPPLHNISDLLLNEKTDDGKFVKEIAGKIVGRVPANISKVFNELLKSGMVNSNSILCISEGAPQHSLTPHFKA